MGFEFVAVFLTIAVFGIPFLAWTFLRRLSNEDKQLQNAEELKALENSLSLMIKELQDSVDKALGDMGEAADGLNQIIEKADDRLRQLEYYYEYGDELRPLVQPVQPQVSQTAQTSQPTEHQAPAVEPGLRHREVHELSRKGWSATQIAKHTGMSADEVQLIINLMEISTMGSNRELQPQQPRHTIM
ncbi:MAG TPA: hypothetical protein VGK02_05515 [Candidatus Aquicultor sp.]|jgi:hypothetical protein